MAELKSTIKVESQGIEEFLAFTKKAKEELLAIEKILQSKGFKGSGDELKKAAVVYRKTMIDAIADVKKADLSKTLEVMELQKKAAKSSSSSPQVNKELEAAIRIIKQLTEEQDKNTKSKKNATAAIKDELVQLEAEKIKKRENTLVAKQNAIIALNEKDAIAALKAQLSLVTLQWNKLTQEEIKNTSEGRKLASEKKRLTELLLKEEKATGQATRQVGFYEKATAGLGKTLLKLSVGRDIIRGLFQGFKNIISENKEVDASAKSISDSFDRLYKIVTSVALSFASYLAPALEKAVDLFDRLKNAIFGTEDVYGNLNSQLETQSKLLLDSNLSVESRKVLIDEINEQYKDYLPSLIEEGDNMDVIRQKIDGANASLSERIRLKNIESTQQSIAAREVSLNKERLSVETLLQKALNKRKSLEADINAGANVPFEALSSVENEIQQLNDQLSDLIQKSKENIELKVAFGTPKPKKPELDAETIKRNAEADKAAKDKADKEAEAARLKEIERKKQLEQELITISENRIKAQEQLENELSSLRIDAIEDVTEKALAVENERFRLEREQSLDNFIELRNQRLDELEKIKEFLGEKSEAYIKFEIETYIELRNLADINNDILQQKQVEHQLAIQGIKDEAAKTSLEASKKAFLEEVEANDALWNEYIENNEEREEEEIRKSIDNQKKLESAIISGVGTAFDAVNKIMSAASEAENAMFDQALQARQKSIDNLNEKLNDATGVQKEYLEKQIQQEKEAQRKLKEQADQARKEQAEAARAIALSQAIVNTALAVTSALATPPYPVGAALAVAAGIAGAAEITTIALQKFEQGGEIVGNSHANGGVRASVKGGADVELEGGEIVFSRKAVNFYGKNNLLKANEQGNRAPAEKFEFGGEIAPNFQSIAKIGQSEQKKIIEQIERLNISVNVTDISNLQNKMAAVSAQSTI